MPFSIEISTLFLSGVAFITSTLSASVGFLGGTLLLTAMAQVIPLNALIPVHGTVQFWSNISRVYFLIQHVNKKIFSAYALGSVVGSALVSQFLFQLNDGIYSLVLGVFILITTLLPKPEKGIQFKGKWLLVGFFASWIGLFMGAVGTFVGAMFLSEPLEKKELVGTQAACQALLHFLKVVVFVMMGFRIGEWLGFLMVMLVMTVLGSFVGTRILEKIPQKVFLIFFKAIVIILSLKLIIEGIQNWN